MRKRTLGIRKQGAPKIADVEFRVLWNEAGRDWHVLRNGAETSISARKKKTSAVASEIRDAKAEVVSSQTHIVVTCVHSQKFETLWRGIALQPA